MQKISASNWISAARACAPAGRTVSYVSAMTKPRADFADTHRQPTRV